jgi:hypothetical protein
MNVEILTKLVNNFRRVMEQSTTADFDGTSLSASQFPIECCDDASMILAAYLTDNGFSGAELVIGSSPDINSHAWLLLDGYIIDITADQFNERGYSNPVAIISNNSVFHSSFDNTESNGEADFRTQLIRFNCPRLISEFKICYRDIQSWLVASKAVRK